MWVDPRSEVYSVAKINKEEVTLDLMGEFQCLISRAETEGGVSHLPKHGLPKVSTPLHPP